MDIYLTIKKQERTVIKDFENFKTTQYLLVVLRPLRSREVAGLNLTIRNYVYINISFLSFIHKFDVPINFLFAGFSKKENIAIDR